jgi:hypothetical protein
MYDDHGGLCSTHEEMTNTYEISVRKPKGQILPS